MPKDAQRKFRVIHSGERGTITTVTAVCYEIVDGVAVFYSTLDAALKDIVFSVKEFAYVQNLDGQ